MQERIRLTVYVMLTMVFVAGLFEIIVASMPSNALTPRYKTRKLLNSLLPEGWSFFTRNPREEMADIYRVEGQYLVRITDCNSEPANFMGFSRKSRKAGMELSAIAGQVPARYWYKYHAVYADPGKDVCAIKNRKDLHILSPGMYVVAIYPPVPWTYARFPQHYTRTYKLAKIKI
ncbi:SdpA family antimicrobial peptide system protein [Chitinophaga japonensis]|uniref:Antimicrobial peptide system SdpA family protein n=1 Tax=Chitinophaga japonensis TaxID=104662 RepID=A0A562STC7_CHIJA|nr:SdpA family antimicrobial peptide system protein [Chitinophaga japonensis]TWI84501.1 antimicrobial peptide system SdpA family protein [Chitinophaga japonensis]